MSPFEFRLLLFVVSVIAGLLIGAYVRGANIAAVLSVWLVVSVVIGVLLGSVMKGGGR